MLVAVFGMYYFFPIFIVSMATDLPVACSIFPGEITRPIRKWAERKYPNLIHWHELPRGGHFAAFEQPELFVDELRDAFRSIRNGAA